MEEWSTKMDNTKLTCSKDSEERARPVSSANTFHAFELGTPRAIARRPKRLAEETHEPSAGVQGWPPRCAPGPASQCPRYWLGSPPVMTHP